MADQRRKIWIDRFQTVLFWRIAFYFVFYQAAVWSLVVIEWNTFNTLESLFGTTMALNFMIFMAVVVVGVGILFIYDAIKVAHRIVGPLVRFRKAFQAIRDGDEVELIKLREGDHLQELRNEFNEMLKVLEERGAIVIKTPEQKSQEKQSSSAVPAAS